jgi:REP element-mobilizing transposase RayT
MGTRHRTKFENKRVRFITTTCKDWLPVLNDDKDFNILIDSLNFVNNKYGCEVLAYVLMPNHIHLINLFNNGEDVSDYMRDLKKYTSGELRRKMESVGDLDLLDKLHYTERQQKFKIWQDRFDDVYLEGINVIETKVRYIHQNPVRKGIVQRAEEYVHSSARFYNTGEVSGMKVTHYLDALGWGSHYYYGQIR